MINPLNRGLYFPTQNSPKKEMEKSYLVSLYQYDKKGFARKLTRFIQYPHSLSSFSSDNQTSSTEFTKVEKSLASLSLSNHKNFSISEEMQRRILSQISHSNKLNFRLTQNFFFSLDTTQNQNLSEDNDDPLYSDVPKPRRDKSERKPYPTHMKVLIRRAKEEKKSRKIEPVKLLERPPDNGLLVPELVHVAHQVYKARESLISGLSKLVKVTPVQRCRFCSEVHIGNVGHEIRTCIGPKSGLRSATHVWRKGKLSDVVFFPKCFHLHDRVGKSRVVHDERYSVSKVPAIVELCIQAGVDVENYPTKRRTKPVYSIEGRIVDFELVTENDEIRRDVNLNLNSENVRPLVESDLISLHEMVFLKAD